MTSECDEAGVDEAGRGALAFDVCAAAVVLPQFRVRRRHHEEEDSRVYDGPERGTLDAAHDDVEYTDATTGAVVRLSPRDVQLLACVKDSKTMSRRKRDDVEAFVRRVAVNCAVGVADAEEVDRHNVLRATHLAMHRALEEVSRCRAAAPLRHIHVDGNTFTPFYDPAVETWTKHTCVPRGDADVLSIAAASILAKTHRDRCVERACDADPSLDARYGFRSNKAYGARKHLEGLRTHGPCEHHRKTFAPVRDSML